MSSPEDTSPTSPRRYGILFYAGAGGLLLAMAIEAIAVAGRQLGTPLLGALEIIQAAILVTASASMLSATLGDTHASVRLLIERLPPHLQLATLRLAHAVGALFFGCLSFALGWLTLETWQDHEYSELLRIPYRPLRIIATVMIAAMALTLAYKACTARPRGKAT